MVPSSILPYTIQVGVYPPRPPVNRGQLAQSSRLGRHRMGVCATGWEGALHAARHSATAATRALMQSRMPFIRQLRSGYAGSAPSTPSTSFPYFRSFDSPTPDTRSRSDRFAGRADAMAASVASWKITYAGTPPARAVSSRQRRNRSSVSAGA